MAIVGSHDGVTPLYTRGSFEPHGIVGEVGVERPETDIVTLSHPGSFSRGVFPRSE